MQESPKSPFTQTPITQSLHYCFQILLTHNIALYLSYFTRLDLRLRRLRAGSYQIVCTPGHPNNCYCSKTDLTAWHGGGVITIGVQNGDKIMSILGAVRQIGCNVFAIFVDVMAGIV
jgi:hypothetical protein